MIIDPYANIHEANLIEAHKRGRNSLNAIKTPKAKRTAVNSMQTEASQSAYNRAITAVFSR